MNRKGRKQKQHRFSFTFCPHDFLERTREGMKNLRIGGIPTENRTLPLPDTFIDKALSTLVIGTDANFS
jgi:hypothetical protein